MKTKNTCAIKIERDYKKLLLIDFIPNNKKIGDDLKYNINLIARDNDHIFSYYGENGTGKSTICKKIKTYKDYTWRAPKPLYTIIDIKEELSRYFNSVNFLSQYWSESVNFYELLDNDNKRKLLLDNFYNIEYDSYPNNIREFNVIDTKMNKWWKKNKLIDINWNIFFEPYDYNTGHIIPIDNSLCILMKIIETYAIENKIILEDLIDNYESHKEKISSFDNTNLVSILNDDKINNLIMNFYKKYLKKQNWIVKNRYVAEIDLNKKILNFINANFKKDFSMLSNFIFYELKSTEHYSSFLNIKYNKTYVIEYHQNYSIPYDIRDFLSKISEGQNKLFKLLFVLAKIAVVADNKTIIIADDILNSFDNKNVMNIISLLNKVLKIKKPILMFFTHEFEIFGMVNKILKVKKDSSFIMSRIKKTIEITPINTKDMTLEEYIGNKKNKNHPIQIKVLFFLVLCVYGRNLVERTLGDKSNAYIMITSLIHLKINSEEIISDAHLIADLKFLDFFSSEDIKEIEEFSKDFSSYFAMVKNVFEYCKKTNVDKIELNIFLSLYGRLCIEEAILKKLTKSIPERKILLSSIKTYQTGALIKKYGNDVNINALNDYITKFIHINQGLSYLINIESKILFKLINKIK